MRKRKVFHEGWVCKKFESKCMNCNSSKINKTDQNIGKNKFEIIKDTSLTTFGVEMIFYFLREDKELV